MDDGCGAPPPLRRGRCLHRPAVGLGKGLPLFVSPPACGCLVGRAISPAAWGLRHRRVCGTMRALPPAGGVSERNRYEVPALSAEIVPYETWGQGPAGVCRIPVGQGGNAPLRLRLTAHPPPLAGEALGELPPGRLPCKGSCRRQPTEGCGALPRQYPSGLAQGPPGGRERPPYNAK